MDRNYLEQLAKMETPAIRRGMSNNLYQELCSDYEELRNLAKGLLSDSRNKEKIVELSGLIRKLNLNTEILAN